MTRFLIYVFPALADVIVAATLFVCSNRLADAGCSRTEVALVFAAWAAIYILGNQVLARLVTSRNAAAMMITANLLFTALAGVFVLVAQPWAIYTAMGLFSIASSMFFLPFQVFMKAVEPDQHQGVVRSTALYTFSWSLGFAGGPFIAGFIYQGLGWQWCFAFTALLGLLTAGGVQLLKHHAKHHHSENAAAQPHACPIRKNADAINYHTMPDFAWLGWIVGGVGCLGIYSLLSLLPSVGVALAIAKSHVGAVTAAIYIMQSLTGLSLLGSKTWMFRPLPPLGFAACGIVSLAVFVAALSPRLAAADIGGISLPLFALYAAAACYGVFSGSFYFQLVFYSLVHPLRSARNVAINETVVGICGVAGPVMAGAMADRFGFVAFPMVLMVLIAAAMLLQAMVLMLKRSVR